MKEDKKTLSEIRECRIAQVVQLVAGICASGQLRVDEMIVPGAGIYNNDLISAAKSTLSGIIDSVHSEFEKEDEELSDFYLDLEELNHEN